MWRDFCPPLYFGMFFYKKNRCSLPLEQLGTSRMSYFTTLSGWVTRKGLKETEVISKELQWLHAHGISWKTVRKNEGLLSQEIDIGRFCTKTPGLVQNKERKQELTTIGCLYKKKGGGDEVNLVTLTHLKGIFTYVAGGLALSFVVFIVEVLTKSCCKK